MRQGFLKIAMSLFLLLLLLAGGVVGGLYVLFETPRGQQFILKKGQNLLATHNLTAELEGVSSHLPMDLTIKKIRLFQKNDSTRKVLIKIENLDIQFHWQDLLRGKLTFPHFFIKSLDAKNMSDLSSNNDDTVTSQNLFKLSFLFPLLRLSLYLPDFRIETLKLPLSYEPDSTKEYRLEGSLFLYPQDWHKYDHGYLKLQQKNSFNYAEARIIHSADLQKTEFHLEIDEPLSSRFSH